MKGPTLFVVLTTQRSGSGWLVDLLNDHAAVVAYGEMFRVTDTTVAEYGATAVPRFEVMVGPETFSTSAGLGWRRYRYVRGLAKAHEGVQAVGFKLMYDQARDHPALLHALVLARAKFVHLVRRDHLSALVSFDAAFERDRWHYHDGQDVPRPRLRVDSRELYRRITERDREIRMFRRRLSRLPAKVHEIEYEAVCARQAETLDELLAFLGVPPAGRTLRSSLVRTGSERGGLEAIENWEEVVAAFSGTRFAFLVRERAAHARSGRGWPSSGVRPRRA